MTPEQQEARNQIAMVLADTWWVPLTARYAMADAVIARVDLVVQAAGGQRWDDHEMVWSDGERPKARDSRMYVLPGEWQPVDAE